MNLKNRTTCFLVFILFICVNINYGQGFVTPLESLQGDATIITTDGKMLNGKIRSASFGPRGISRLSFIENNNKKHVLKPANLKSLKIKVDDLAKLEMLADKTSNLKKLINADFDEIVDRKYIYYERVELPNKKGSYRLLQLVNPGFDQKLKVYHNPLGKSGTTSIGNIAVSGNEARSYIVTRRGVPGSVIIRKNKYRKAYFPDLFGNCPRIKSMYPVKEIDFEDFAEHIVVYNKLCK